MEDPKNHSKLPGERRIDFNYYGKNVFGNDLMYAADNDARDAMMWLRPGQKTVTEQDLTALRFFGYEPKQVLPPKK